jgi:hypothetical protein
VIVKAWLEGHQFDLDALAELLPAGDTRVVLDGDGYYLTATEIDNRPAGAVLRHRAEGAPAHQWVHAGEQRRISV